MKDKYMLIGIIALAAVVLFTSVWGNTRSTQKNDDVDDFRVMPLDGGKSLAIIRYAGEKQVVNVPSRLHGRPVTRIGDSTFRGKEIIDVTIPNGVTAIGNRAFAENLLTSVTIPASVTIIGNRAFEGNQLGGVTIGNGVTTVGERAFAENQLASVTIPNSVKEIGELAFNSNQLTSVTIGNSVTSIGVAAFSNNQLTSVTIPNGVTEIGGSAFYNNQLVNVTIGSGVTSIGTGAFAGNALTDLTLAPDNSAFIINGYFLLSKDEKQLVFYYGRERNVTILDSVTEIGGGAFAENQLASVTIPNSVTDIRELAFYQNPLTSITIGANVEIERNAFSNDFAASDFTTFYNNQRRRAGTYVLSSGRWVLQ